MSAYTHSGVVYFVAVGQYVKIGYSSGDLETRVRKLVTGGSRLICPDDLDRTEQPQILHTIPGCIIRDERRIHGLFAAHHVVGEWYRHDLAFLRHLAALEFVTDAEVLMRFRRARAALKKSSLARAAA